MTARFAWTALCALLLLPQDEPLPDGVYARIDGEDIREERFAGWLLEVAGPAYFQTFASDVIVHQEAARRGITLAADLVEARLDREIQERIDAGFRGNRELWVERDLLAKGMTEAAWRATERPRVERILLTERILLEDRAVTEEDVRTAWEIRYGTEGVDLDLRGMFFSFRIPTLPPTTPPEERERQREEAAREAMARAGQAIARVEAGEDWSVVAAEVTENPQGRETGGLIDVPLGVLGLEVEAWVALAEVGQDSGPVRSNNGVWYLRLENRTVTPLESVAEQLRTKLATRPPTLIEVAGWWNVATQTRPVRQR